MNMFCFQCQETVGNQGCTKRGVCGKDAETAARQDLLVDLCKGIGWWSAGVDEEDLLVKAGRFVASALFMTITNANFDSQRFESALEEGFSLRRELRRASRRSDEGAPSAALWEESGEEARLGRAVRVGVLSTEDPDIRSLRELTIYGLKGLSAYAHHASVLGFEDQKIYAFILDTMGVMLEDKSVDEMIALVLETGKRGADTMALLDKANTETYGNPEITEVNIGVGDRPGILVSGHDLKDLAELLEQTKGTGVDVYTHSEMLPAHYYPAFKKYDHFAGNYGNAWWKQDKEFASFNGPILMTTNCITPVKEAYKDRIYTTGEAGYPGVPHIADRPQGGTKDYSSIIEQAKQCEPPQEIERGSITGGFAHAQVTALADKVVSAVKSGAIQRFVVMAGCDGRQKGRSYFTEVAEALPETAVILTAGCAKYRYNKLNLGDIGGIPRVLDAGQCNDSYSLAVIALKLQEAFELEDVNELPLEFDLAWYEQKAVIVLLALLALGFKGIRLGPTLPAFLSPNVAKVLVENFGIKPIGKVEEDVAAIMGGAS